MKIVKSCVLALGMSALSLSATADTLSLHLIRSPFGINWSKPQALAFSTLVNQIGGAHTVGHAYARVKCEGRDGEAPYETVTGMTSEGTAEERQLLLTDKIGFGLFWHSFKGKFQKGEEVERDLAHMRKEKRLRTVDFTIPAATCRRLQAYVTEFERDGHSSNYGLANDPLKKEGAGCTAYAMSFVELAGIPMGDFTESWSKRISIPYRYIGGPLNPGRRVDIFKLSLNPNAGKWATGKSKSREIFFWDPDAMYGWAKRVAREGISNVEGMPLVRASARRLVLDAIGIATPKGSFWRE